MTEHAPRAPRGSLSSYERETFSDRGIRHDVFRKGHGPAVLILTELPNITPYVLGLADRVAAQGFTVVVPNLFGTAGRDPEAGNKLTEGLYTAAVMGRICIRREFSLFASGKTSKGIGWLRALAREEYQRCGGPGVGVVGLCFTGGFALGMAVDPHVLAPVMAEPSLPLGFTPSQRSAVGLDPKDVDAVAARCEREGLRVLGLRFKDDPFVPAERFDFLREKLGEGFIAVELEQCVGHEADQALSWHHSVLTNALVDRPNEPTRDDESTPDGETTRDALDRVLDLLRDKLLTAEAERRPRSN